MKFTDSSIELIYNFRLCSLGDGEKHQFFIAGLFNILQEDGTVVKEKLWACDETGNPMLFSSDKSWVDAQFYYGYPGADIEELGEEVIELEEARIIMYDESPDHIDINIMNLNQ